MWCSVLTLIVLYKRCYHHKKSTTLKREIMSHVQAILDWSVMRDFDLVESWKYFAELIVDVTEKFVPVSNVPSDALKCKPYLTAM